MYKRNIQLYIMRIICIICLLVHVLCFQTACTILSETPRETTNINNTWKYAQGDYTGAEQVDYDDMLLGKHWYSSFFQHTLLYGKRFLCGVWVVSETFATG